MSHDSHPCCNGPYWALQFLFVWLWFYRCLMLVKVSNSAGSLGERKSNEVAPQAQSIIVSTLLLREHGCKDIEKTAKTSPSGGSWQAGHWHCPSLAKSLYPNHPPSSASLQKQGDSQVCGYPKDKEARRSSEIACVQFQRTVLKTTYIILRIKPNGELEDKNKQKDLF